MMWMPTTLHETYDAPGGSFTIKRADLVKRATTKNAPPNTNRKISTPC